MKNGRCLVVVVAALLFQVVQGGAAEPPGTGAPVIVLSGPPVEKSGFERTFAATAAPAKSTNVAKTAHDIKNRFIAFSFLFYDLFGLKRIYF